jgi:hypothetical protein
MYLRINNWDCETVRTQEVRDHEEILESHLTRDVLHREDAVLRREPALVASVRK